MSRRLTSYCGSTRSWLNDSSATANASLVVVASVGFGGVAWQWSRAEDRRREAEFERGQAERARDAETRHRMHIEAKNYIQKIGLAQREWLAGDSERALQLLEECPVEKRGWEWRYLDALVA